MLTRPACPTCGEEMICVDGAYTAFWTCVLCSDKYPELFLTVDEEEFLDILFDTGFVYDNEGEDDESDSDLESDGIAKAEGRDPQLE